MAAASGQARTGPDPSRCDLLAALVRLAPAPSTTAEPLVNGLG